LRLGHDVVARQVVMTAASHAAVRVALENSLGERARYGGLGRSPARDLTRLDAQFLLEDRQQVGPVAVAPMRHQAQLLTVRPQEGLECMEGTLFTRRALFDVRAHGAPAPAALRSQASMQARQR